MNEIYIIYMTILEVMCSTEGNNIFKESPSGGEII
jgi:hypothetical protein